MQASEQHHVTFDDRSLIKQIGFIRNCALLDKISFPSNSNNGTVATVVASLGDNPDHPQPIELTWDMFLGYTVTLYTR